jgi:hypothetical protein
MPTPMPCLYIVYKGSPELKLDKLPTVTIALAIVLTAAVITGLAMLIWLPFVYAKVVRKDYTIKWYHFFYGPLLWRRPAPTENPDNVAFVPDYRIMREEDQPDVSSNGNGMVAETGGSSEFPITTPIDKSGRQAGSSSSQICKSTFCPILSRSSLNL